MKVAQLITHVALGLSLLMLVHTAKSYLGLTNIILPTIETASPVTANKTAEVISLQLPNSEHGESARRLVQSQTNEIHMLHQSWLAHTQLQLLDARYQLIGWTLLSALSLGLTVALHVRSRGTG